MDRVFTDRLVGREDLELLVSAPAFTGIKMR